MNFVDKLVVKNNIPAYKDLLEASNREIKLKMNRSQSHSKILSENAESRYSQKVFADKNIDRIKKLTLLSDEIDDENQYSEKKKIEMILDMLMYDRSLLSDRTFSNSFTDQLISQIYISLSPEARKLVVEKYIVFNYYRVTDQETLLYFHNLIGFNLESFKENPEMSNDTLMNICNNIIRIEDSKLLFNIVSGYKPEIQDGEKYTVIEDLFEVAYHQEKLVFAEDIKSSAFNDKMNLNKIVSIYTKLDI
jgi:hypothetical protein